MKRIKRYLLSEVPHILSDTPSSTNPRFLYKVVNQEVLASLKSETTSHPSRVTKNHPFPQNVPTYNVPTKDFVEGVIGDVHSGEFFKLTRETERSKILVEFSSPNIAKPFHMGHLRSTLLGNFVANILAETKLQVIRINYLGDWGTQFGLVLAGLGAKVDDLSLALTNLENCGYKLNEPFDIKNSNNIVRHICDAYVKANQDEQCAKSARELTAAMEQGKAAEAVDIWKAIRRISVDHLKETYKDLGIPFDYYIYESDFSKSLYSMALDLLLRKDVVKEENGQMVLCDSGLPLGRSDGASLYLGRDIASALFRVDKFTPTSMLYVIDKSQQNHVSALISAMSQVSNVPMSHIQFGKITGMSTRAGKGVLLSDIMEEAFERMAEQQRKSPTTRDMQVVTTRTLALSNLCVYLLRQRRLRDLKFSWDAAVLGTGDSGSRLQYCHSRLTSLEDMADVSVTSSCQYSVLRPNTTTLQLIATIANYEDMVQTCAETLESSHAVNYAFQLCHCISKCLKEVQVKGEEIPSAEQRLLMFSSAKTILAKTMKLLGIMPLGRM